MVKFIEKYAIWIVVILFALFMLQTCRSCAKGNTLTWSEAECATKVDSLNAIITRDNKTIDSLKFELGKAKERVSSQAILIETLGKDIEFLKQTNTNLNKNLNKSLDKNENTK